MKKILSILLVVILLSACAPGPVTPGATIKKPELQKVADVYELMEKYALPAEQVQKLRHFQSESVSRLFTLEQNEFYSALSLYTALSLVAPGAVDSTAAEFENVLGMKPEELKAFMKNLVQRFNYDSEADGKMHLANAAWVDQKYKINPDYEKTIREDFLAAVMNIDFEDPKAGEQITAWVKEHTFGLLAPEYKDLKDTALLLANALYMNANWTEAFPADATKPDAFHALGGETLQKDFMHQQQSYAYLVDEDMTVLVLPMHGGLQMKFFMPKGDLKALLADPAALDSVLNRELGFGKVNLSLPKFETASTMELIPVLRALGLSEATTDQAKIPNMADKNLMISNVIQNSKIKLDEKGVEAAAVTTVEMQVTSAPMETEPVDIKLDRPFAYVIESQEGVPLFIGTMIK